MADDEDRNRILARRAAFVAAALAALAAADCGAKVVFVGQGGAAEGGGGAGGEGAAIPEPCLGFGVGGSTDVGQGGTPQPCLAPP
ncbi:MAG: hypothetical protein U0271_30390 [Polyangiaceae bacterium]